MDIKKVEELLWIALKKAEELGVCSTAAFVDEGGHLRALIRMDGGYFGDIDFAMNKAYTAAAWRCETKDFYEDSLPTGELFGMHISNGGKVVTFAGGMPVFEDGKLIGALGISGGTVEEDQLCLEEVKKALKNS